MNIVPHGKTFLKWQAKKNDEILHMIKTCNGLLTSLPP